MASSTFMTGGSIVVVDVDEGEGLLGHVGVDGGHRGDGVALVQGLVRRQAVVAQEPGVDQVALAHVDDLARGLGQLGAGDDGLHAGEGQGAGGVDGPDAGVGVGAPEDLAVEESGKLDVGAVAGASGDLVGPVVTYGGGAHHLELLCRGVDAGHASVPPWAALVPAWPGVGNILSGEWGRCTARL